jgi:DNA-directed RNA polymerase subunit M/transcription elongation factor TFIIS
MWESYEKLYFKGTACGWDHPLFSAIKDRIDEKEQFIEKPFEIEEGVVECDQCGSKRTFSYQKQVRSSDEGFSLFVTCVECKTSWVEN